MRLSSESIIKLLLRVIVVLEDEDNGGDTYLIQEVWDMIEDLKVFQFNVEEI